MEKRIMLFFILIFIFAGGCGISEEENNGKANQESMPETEAFKDEFTREFIKSTEETEEGYYTFESKTKGYTILFPKDAIVSTGDYEAVKDQFESLSFGEKRIDEKISYFIKLSYEDNSSTGDIDTKLELLSNGAEYKGEYKKAVQGDYMIYSSDAGPKNPEYYYYLAYIKSAASDQAVRFTYFSNCIVEEKSCELITEKGKNRINKILNSIEFKK
ncbi:hypothetical protein [Metabacillus sp. cB07]|uniref:hypothetical protein n=1 Tax=Metabacillus sp. cB07 TaxID=2806989 RepID=UPI001939F1DD|nr:hypothetical protein [Metabacillus sp. cB07]